MQIEKLAIIQEQQIKSQEVTTHNIESLRGDIKQLILSDGDLKVLRSKCDACHRRLDRVEKIWITTAGSGIIILVGVVIDFFHKSN